MTREIRNRADAIANYVRAAAAAKDEYLRLGRFNQNDPMAKAEVEAARILNRFNR